MKILVSVYSFPEGYPPTLNAIAYLSEKAEKIIVLSRNIERNEWIYPNNVSNKMSGAEKITIRESEKKPLTWKFRSFYDFVTEMFSVIKSEKPKVILLYDTIPLFAYSLIERFLNYKPIVWYHNHDVIELSKIRKFTISWAAAITEQKMFKYLDIFSLPSNERKQFFPLEKLKGNYFYIPNLPKRSFYEPFYQKKDNISDTISFIYQGAITEGHGLAKIVGLLNSSILNKNLHLSLAGYVHDNYLDALTTQVKIEKVENKFSYLGVLPYSDLPNTTKKYDIGLAIHEPIGIIYTYGGTASNKIYEYAALGLPVILYDTPHYREHLGQYSWAFFTDLSEKSLIECIEKIVENYEEISAQAHKDFMEKLNFEVYFEKVYNKIIGETI